MEAMRTRRVEVPRRVRRSSKERGFTLAEVLLSIIVFTISVVGVVSVQRATLASQENAMQLREAQRVAQGEIENFKAVGFNDWILADFFGSPNPIFPYDDLQMVRMASYRAAPMDVNPNDAGADARLPPGMRRDFFRVIRRVSAVPSTEQPAGDPLVAAALQFDVWVLWLDHNPAFPPPPEARVETLLPENIVSNSGLFRPYVRGVHMSTVRANDGNFEDATAP